MYLHYKKIYSDKDFIQIEDLFRLYEQLERRIRYSGVVTEEYLEIRTKILGTLENREYIGNILILDNELSEFIKYSNITPSPIHNITYVPSSTFMNTDSKFYKYILHPVFKQIKNFNPKDYLFWITKE